MTRAAVQALRVTHARLDSDSIQIGNSGRVVLQAVVDGAASGATLISALQTDGVSLTVTDGGQFAAAVPLSNCEAAGSGLRCRSPNVHLRVKQMGTRLKYRLRVSVRRLSSGATGSMPPRGPVRLEVHVPESPDLVDVISDCAAVGRLRLGCRDRNRPNIIFLVTDDQRWDTLAEMPATLNRLANHGITFRNSFVTSPLCTPSRASMLTGQYARHHDVRGLGLPLGGALKFVGRDASTLATWLQDAGYRTGMYGKYLTDYAKQCPPYTERCYIPPGWDEWHVFLLQHYYNYALAENDEVNVYGRTPAEYSTDVLGAKAVDFIKSAQGQPFFLHVGFHAPHQDGGALPIPAGRHAGSYAGVPVWRPPSYDEEDISDKPAWLGIQPRAASILRGFVTFGAWGDSVREKQLETLPAVDEAIEAIMAALDDTGQADNTVVVLTSDNGHFWGEHRFFYGKNFPYEESIRVPLVIRYPRLITAPRNEDRPALNIDIVPTLADLAGVPVPDPVDGASLRPLFDGSAVPWRSDFIVELWRGDPDAVETLPDYVGVRADRWKYVAYAEQSDVELYDLVNDPNELDNRAHDPAYQNEVATLQARLDALLAAQ